MKILCVQGQLREGGNTAHLMENVVDALRNKSIAVEVVSLHGRNISDCLDCGGCFDTATCKVDDDMIILTEKLLNADAIILSTPVYMWNMTGILKNFIDRLFCVRDKLEGKKVGLVMTAAGNQFEGADLCVDVVRRLADYTGMTMTQPLFREADGAEGFLKWDRELLSAEIKKFCDELIY